METAVNERVRDVYFYLKKNKIVRTQKEFSDSTGSFPGDISKILNCKKAVPNVLLERICAAYPQISLKWLQAGEGEMVVEVAKQPMYGGDGVPNETVAAMVELLKLKEISLQKSQSQIDSLIELVNKLAK